jgi:hypothetical protein
MFKVRAVLITAAVIGGMLPALQADAAKKEKSRHHQPAQRQHLRGEEVGPDQQRQVDPNESGPGSSALAACCVITIRRQRNGVPSK